MATINGTFNSFVGGTISGSVGVPGPAGATGPAGPTGATGAPGAPGVGVPAGGASGQFLQKTSNVSYETDWVTVSPFITSVSSPLSVNSGVLSIDLSAYLTTASAASIYQTLAGMSSYLTTSAASATYAVIAAGQPTSGTVGQVLTKNSGTNYDSSWQTLIPGDRYLTSSTTSNTLSNTNKTFTIGTGLSYTPTQSITISYNASNHMHGEVLTYNSGTGVLTVDINHHTGSGTYASWVVNVGGVVPATSVTWGSITGTLGSQTDLATALNAKLEVTTAASTYQTLSGMSSYLTTASAASTYATLSSPSLTGTPLSTTAAADTNTTQIATTSFVVGQASSSTPAATGTAAVGSSLRYARADHVHANPLPTGGTTGQVLSKVDGTNYNTTWTTVSGGTFTGGPVTSAITTDNGSGKVGYFGQTFIGYEDDPTGGSYVNKRSYITEDDLYVAKTIAEYGINYTSYSRYRFNGFQAIYNDSSVSSSTFNVGYSTNGVISYTAVTMSGNYDYTLSADGFTFKSPSMAAFFNISSSGIMFPNGTTQTSAGMSPPAYTNAIWYGGVWYSANVNSVTDGYGNYYNVLTI
jgi:hypothetical protein